MIRYVITTSAETSFLEVTATFPNRAPIFIKTKGALKHVRQILRNEMEDHLKLLVADMRGLLKPNITWEPADRVATGLANLERECVHADHVSYARELEHILPDLLLLTRATHHPLMMERLHTELQRTVAFMTEAPESLWVRGPITQLDGTKHEPWKTTKAA